MRTPRSVGGGGGGGGGGAKRDVASLIDITRSISTFSTRDQAGEESAQKSTSYAQVVSTPSNTVPPYQSLPPKQLPQQPRYLNRESNVILFGVPEGKCIIESKAVVDEFLQVNQLQSMTFSV